MTVVVGVAATMQYVFVATPQALGVYDRRFNAWLAPVSRADGWPRGGVTAFAADPSGDAIWVGAEGSVLRYSPTLHDFIRAPLAAEITQMFFSRDDPSSGAYVAAGGAYWRVTPTGLVQRLTTGVPTGARRIDPPTLSSVYQQYPGLRNMERLLTRDDALHVWTVTSGASSPNESQVWLGTAGGGLYEVDPMFLRSQARPFGLLSRGAGAIATGVDGVWVGGLGARAGASARYGLTFIDHALQRAQWFDGGIPSVFAGVRVTGLALFASLVWAATDQGLVRLDARTGSTSRRWDSATGLPSSLALSVVGTQEGAWVGTDRGLAFVHDDGGALGVARATDVTTTLLSGTAVNALLRRGDTLWIGSAGGLLALAPRETQPRKLRAAEANPRLNAAVTAIATHDSVVAFATAAGDVYQLNVRTGELLPDLAAVSSGRAGAVNALAIDERTVWIGGLRGLLVIERATGAQRFLPAESDLAGEVYGIALTSDYAWIAARDGAVRLRRLSDGMVR
jgi:hypothetical protein